MTNITRDAVERPYIYYGKDGKPISARELEDQRDALLARVEELEKEKHSALHQVGVLSLELEEAHRNGRLQGLDEAAALVEPKAPEPSVDPTNAGDIEDHAKWVADNQAFLAIQSLKETGND